MKRFSLSCLLTTLLIFLLFPLSACKSKANYVDYLAEFRSEIYKAEQDGFQVTVFFSSREYPYELDGICATTQDVVEVFFTTPDNTKDYEIYLDDNQTVGGDASYDSAHCRFSYSQSLSPVTAPSVPVTIRFEDTEIKLQANTVKTGNELPMPEIISKLVAQRNELFSSLQNGKTFLGELRVRLTYNDRPYYFVCVTSTSKQTSYFLLDACSGDILAERNG